MTHEGHANFAERVSYYRADDLKCKTKRVIKWRNGRPNNGKIKFTVYKNGLHSNYVNQERELR